MSRTMLLALTGHGYGHAAQMAPIIAALRQLVPDLRLIIRSQLSPSLLSEFFPDLDGVSRPEGDFGMVMASPLDVDRDATARRYRDLHHDFADRIAAEADALRASGADFVLANIPYLTLAGARRAGIPCMGLSSLNWLTIYREYCGHDPEAGRIAAEIEAAYRAADQFVVLTPTMPMPEWPVQSVGPVARLGRAQPERLPAADRRVLISQGGVTGQLDLASWPSVPGVVFIVAGQPAPARPDMVALADTGLSHLDCLASVDALIGKTGYGTVVEAACHGIPTLYVNRPDWPEEPPLVAWLHQQCAARVIVRADLEAGRVAEPLAALWAQPRPTPPLPTGNEEAAAILAERLAGRLAVTRP